MQINQHQFKLWITQHHSALYRHAFWMTANNELAKDIVQDTYYQAWKYRTSLRDENKVLPWLLTILRRLVYKECQHSDAKPVSLEELEPVSVQTAPIDHTDTMIDLERDLNSLNTSQREILLLYALHGFTYEEISEQLEIPPGTVMSRLSRARDALKVLQTKPGDSNIINLKNHSRLRKNVD